MLELGSSPGRMVGDARGRWGVGAVPRPGRITPHLAAALHVFDVPAAAAAVAAAPDPAPAPVAVLVESAAGSAGVVQLLSDGERAPCPSPAANAIVLSSSSQQSGDTPKRSISKHQQTDGRTVSYLGCRGRNNKFRGGRRQVG